MFVVTDGKPKSLVRHGQDDRLDQLLDLLVEAADVGVLFRGPCVNLRPVKIVVETLDTT